MALCDFCGEVFSNPYQLGPHKRVCRKAFTSSSESSEEQNEEEIESFRAAEEEESEARSEAFELAEEEESEAHEAFAAEEEEEESVAHTSLWELARRERNWGSVHPCRVNQPVVYDNARTHDYCTMQKAWRTYTLNVYDLCSPEFWRMFELVKEEKGTSADKILRRVKQLLHAQGPTVRFGHLWPTSNRTLKNRIQSKLGNFWDNVTHELQIDLSVFKCGRVKKVQFSFIDPVYVWVRQCEMLQQSGQQLVFDCKILKDPDTGEEIYGAGIEYGLLLRAATASVPRDGKVALINLSWDGGDTGYKSRSVVPICVQVMNTNSGSKFGVGLVGYLPLIEVSNAMRETKAYKAASHHLLQVICCKTRICFIKTHICLSAKHAFVL